MSKAKKVVAPVFSAATKAAASGWDRVSGQRDARKAAEREQARMQSEADARNAEYLSRTEQDRKRRAGISFGLRKSLLSRARAGGNYGGTLLTSPLGSGSGSTVLGG